MITTSLFKRAQTSFVFLVNPVLLQFENFIKYNDLVTSARSIYLWVKYISLLYGFTLYFVASSMHSALQTLNIHSQKLKLYKLFYYINKTLKLRKLWSYIKLLIIPMNVTNVIMQTFDGHIPQFTVFVIHCVLRINCLQ